MANRVFVGSMLAVATALVLVPSLANAGTNASIAIDGNGATASYSSNAAVAHSGVAHAGTDGAWCAGGGQAGSRVYFYECGLPPVPSIPQRNLKVLFD